jgi:hypothetical protein
LPDASTLHIVSLLGRLKDGFSEFSYYPFKSEHETGEEPTFQAWLDRRYGYGRFIVHEFPTTNGFAIPVETMMKLIARVSNLLKEGKPVVFVDSAGSLRNQELRETLGLTVQII